MTPFLVRVHATPGEKIAFEGARPKGYYQSFGVTAKDERELASYVGAFVAEDTGGNVVEIDDVVVADLEYSHRAIRDACGDVKSPGVWYASGRAFFDDDDDEDSEP